MHPDLVKLLELQARDQALLEADQHLAGVLAEVDALDQQLADLERAIAEAERAGAEAKRRRSEVEAKMENYRKLEERGRQRLEQVRSPKEIQAVMTEMDLARQVLQKEESDWVVASDAVNGHERRARDAAERLATLRDEQQLGRAELGERLLAAEGQREKARLEREQTAGEVNKALRMRYERLRQSRKTTVVVALSGAGCGACFTAVPLNRRSQIQAGMLIDSCESCGVILYAAETVE